MSKQQTSTTRLGLFVTIALAVFAITVYNIGNKQNLFGSTFNISSVFQNVNGLTTGNNVRYSGINVGIVDQIVIINDSTLRVDMEVQDEVRDFLKKDAVASIGTDGLVGNMIVNISPGKGARLPVEDGDMIQSFTRLETGQVLSTLGNTTENIALLTINLLEIAENINSGEGSIARIINDPSMAHDLQLAIQNLKTTTEYITSLSAGFDESLKQVKEGEGLLGYLLTDTTFRNQINGITTQLDHLVAVRVDPILNNLTRSSEDIATTTSELKSLIDEINLNEGLAGTILKDSLITKDLKETMQNLNQGTDRFNENMEAMKHNFLFRRYFKKQEKERQKALKEGTAVVRR